jgi:hypothetical protein
MKFCRCVNQTAVAVRSGAAQVCFCARAIFPTADAQRKQQDADAPPPRLPLGFDALFYGADASVILPAARLAAHTFA